MLLLIPLTWDGQKVKGKFLDFEMLKKYLKEQSASTDIVTLISLS